MTHRRPLIAGNWKMHQTAASAGVLVAEICAAIPPQSYDDVDVVLCPPYTALASVAQAIAGSGLHLGAQDVSAHEWGAYTAQISAPMLLEFGTRYVIVGHSECRAYARQQDEEINAKVRRCLKHGLIPIVAVGETHEEHAAGKTHERVTGQIREAFAGVEIGDVERAVVAYEPVWAIGSGTSDTPEEAATVIAAIRSAVPGLERARCLYGGSMKPENAAALLAQPQIDGGLIGGASLNAQSFAQIVDHARKAITTP
ncbi:triose-phosphate isomerase [bacterium]|nr:MAG: triose-phosphate isomerase [bacterium]